MSNEQDPKNVENEPKAADELASEELDEVVGGAGPNVVPGDPLATNGPPIDPLAAIGPPQ